MQSNLLIKESVVKQTARVLQLAGMFDLSDTDTNKIIVNFDFSNFKLPEQWNIGLILGKSGSGKSTFLETFFKDRIYDIKWNNESIIDNFDKKFPIADITKTLSAVGFSSPPSWLKPYYVLSIGEKFRCNIARLISEYDFFCIDEFTSVIDRTVAQIGCAAIHKEIKTRNKKMIAASCHYDIAEWLQPDWIYDLNTNQFSMVLLRRPQIKLSIYEVKRSCWQFFRKYHYLDNDINSVSKCYCAFYKDIPVCFIAFNYFPHPQKKGRSYKIHRLVVLPDFQGVGIGMKVLDIMADIYSKKNNVTITSALKSVYNSLLKNKKWKLMRYGFCSKPVKTTLTGGSPFGNKTRKTFSFKYIGNEFLTLTKGLNNENRNCIR